MSHFKFYKSLGSQNYLSILKFLNGVIGNSSSGISEAPYFGIKTLNLGDRQTGRILMPSIINCTISEKNIKNELKKLLFDKKITKQKKNYFFYGNGNTSKKIAKKISNFNFKIYKKKVFVDL